MTVLVNQRAPRTREVVHIMEQFGRYDSSIGSKIAHASYTFNWKDNEFQIWGTKRDLNLLGKSVWIENKHSPHEGLRISFHNTTAKLPSEIISEKNGDPR